MFHSKSLLWRIKFHSSTFFRNENRILNIRTITLKKFFLSSKENVCVRLLKTQKSTVIWDLKKLLDHIHEIQQKNQNNVKLRYKFLWWRKHWLMHTSPLEQTLGVWWLYLKVSVFPPFWVMILFCQGGLIPLALVQQWIKIKHILIQTLKNYTFLLYNWQNDLQKNYRQSIGWSCEEKTFRFVKNFFDQRIFHYQSNVLNRHGFKLFKNLKECVNTTFSNM